MLANRIAAFFIVQICFWSMCGLIVTAGDKTAPAEIRKLMEQLGADSFRDRRAASKRLTEIGEIAAPFLVEGLKSDDPEIKERCAKILDTVGYVLGGGYNEKRYAEVKVILDGVRGSSDAQLAALVKDGKKYVREIMQVCREGGQGSASIYGMIALTRIKHPQSYPVLAGMFNNINVVTHMSGYVAAIKDPFMVYCLIRRWQADKGGSSDELTKQIHRMFPAAKGKDDPAAVMKAFMAENGANKKLQANIKWLKAQHKVTPEDMKKLEPFVRAAEEIRKKRMEMAEELRRAAEDLEKDK